MILRTTAAIVEFCLTVPLEEFLRDGQLRSLARRSMGALPASTLQRTNGAANPPIGTSTWRRCVADGGGSGTFADLAIGEPHAGPGPNAPLIENWPSSGFERADVSRSHHVALTRGFSVGKFLMQYDPEAAPAQIPIPLGTTWVALSEDHADGKSTIFFPLGVSKPECELRANTTMLDESWFATSSHWLPGSSAKWRGTLTAAANPLHRFQRSLAIVDGEHRDAVIAAIRRIEETARRIDRDRAAVFEPLNLRQGGDVLQPGERAPLTIPCQGIERVGDLVEGVGPLSVGMKCETSWA